jgi:alpha-N-acetylglucosaminidase
VLLIQSSLSLPFSLHQLIKIIDMRLAKIRANTDGKGGRYIAKIDTSWNSETPFTIPMPLPKVGGQAIKKHSLVEWSYYENVCTFSYTQAWWSWDRWQREIDWMAMSGINLPLALTGYEYVQQRTFERFGVTREEMQEYFTGPGFLAWNRMVNIKGWGGAFPRPAE